MQWSQFHQLQQQFSQALLATQEKLQEVALGTLDCSRLEAAAHTVGALLEEHRLRQSVRQELTAQGHALVEIDPSSATAAQGIIASADSNYEKVLLLNCKRSN